jgi:hypothetical protein
LNVRSRIVLIIAILLLATAGFGQSITVSQSIDRTEMAFEDTAKFQITLTWAGPPHQYRFDKPLRLDTDNLTVTSFSSSVTSSGVGPDEITTKTYDYSVAPTLSGTGTIRPLDIEYMMWPDSLTGHLTTDPVLLRIAQPRPRAAQESGSILGYLLAALAICGIALAVILWIVMKRRRPVEKPESPAERALNELARVKNDAGQDIKRFQTGLYRILVRYLTDRHGVDLEGLSADQVEAKLGEAGINDSDSEKITAWLKRAEREKFAPVAVAPGEVMRHETDIRLFFERLK